MGLLPDFPVYWVPGNHDAEGLFEAGESENNMHGKVLELQQDLLLAAMGGSTQSFLHDGINKPSKIYHPYPFPTETQYKAFLDSLWTKVTPWLQKTKGQVLLMTHDGPQGMATTTMNQYETIDGFKAG